MPAIIRGWGTALGRPWCRACEVSNGSQDVKLGRLFELNIRLVLLSCLRNLRRCLRKTYAQGAISRLATLVIQMTTLAHCGII
ncbi:MAG: hypothetical protein WCP86_08350 [bacterium]